MNAQIITTISAIGMGLLIFLAGKLIIKPTQEPILIETRKITRRRKTF